MGLFAKMFGNKKPDAKSGSRYEFLSSSSTVFYKWNGKVFESDIIRSAIRPKAVAVGKLNPRHIRGEGEAMRIDPSPAIKAILQKPNPFMSMQDFLVKMVFQREIHHNAFAYVKRDPLTLAPIEVYPIPYSSVEPLEVDGELYIKFWFVTGKYMVVPYVDLIHLRKDFYADDFFGEDGKAALANIMEVITTTDQGIVSAIKNSAVIKWLMSFKNQLRPEDVEIQVNQFVEKYLATGNSTGVAVGMPGYDIKELQPQNGYVPNAAQMKETIQRLWAFFGVNEFIVQNRYDEDQWNAFYEAEIEPIAQQLSAAFTAAFFSAREIGHGNRIIFESSSLQYASMQTKLQLVQMVDRGAMTPNEWRTVMNLGPIEGGDKPIRRLDTAPIEGGNGSESSANPKAS